MQVSHLLAAFGSVSDRKCTDGSKPGKKQKTNHTRTLLLRFLGFSPASFFVSLPSASFASLRRRSATSNISMPRIGQIVAEGVERERPALAGGVAHALAEAADAGGIVIWAQHFEAGG